jgi:hypothetical protein
MRYLTYIVAGALPFGFVLAGWVLSGSVLSAFFAGAVAIALLTPSVMLTQHRTLDRFLIAGCVIDGAGIALLLTLLVRQVGFVDWLVGYLILLCFGLALIGLTLLLLRLFPGALACLLVTVLAIAWLSWPIWLAPHMHRVQGQIDTLVTLHPLMAINARIDHEGLWTHRALSYRLMNLGQDYPYTLPHRTWPTMLMHAAVGAILLAGACKERQIL